MFVHCLGTASAIRPSATLPGADSAALLAAYIAAKGNDKSEAKGEGAVKPIVIQQ